MPVNRKRDATRGSGYEKRIKLLWEKEGYLVHRAQRAAVFLGPGRMFSRRVDLFGSFDLAGLRRGLPVRLAQVWTLTNRSHKREQIEPALAYVDPSDGRTLVEIWSWGKYRDEGYGFLREVYTSEGWKLAGFVPSKEVPR